MAAGLGFKTFTTGEVLTSGDTNGYLMQGVLVFADAAARTAAITSPQEGQTSYLKDTDVIQVYSGSAWVTKSGGSPLTTKGDLYGYSTTDARVAIGTNGQLLTADSTAATGVAWTTVASGGLTAINSGGTSLSGTSTTISSIPATYKSLYMVFTEVTTTAGYGFLLRMNSDTGANYSWGMVAQINKVGQFDGLFADSAGIAMGQYTFSSTSAMRKGYGDVTILNYTQTEEVAVFTNFYNYYTAVPATGTTQGVYNNSAAVSSITVRTDGAQTFATGKIYLYGVN